MTEAHPDRLTTPLLILRITIGLFLLQWGIEKLVIPETTAVIFSHFYKIDGVGENAAMVMGILQSLLALAILFGFQKHISYLLGFLLHAGSTISTIGNLIDPYAPGNHLFMTAVPVLAGMWLLYRMRDADVKFSIDAMRQAPAD